jgi:eukaryotic-like serine/threonine-protein kinase
MKEREVFEAALEIPDPDGRDAFLRAACGGEAAMEDHIRGLLEAERGLGDFLESPALAPGIATAPPSAVEGPGTVIGPYELLESIGEGGMGVVYVAEQARPVRRRVALKVIKPGMDTRQVLARFEAERQALAMMDHPNIAKVHDAGATEAGRPYFVMELVNGLPITEYCDRARLTIPERLELFVLVCRAVQHAHQKGVIHRDLKPSNILVTLIDGAAVPKVIDFGVAKSTGPALADGTLNTGFAQLLGTPLYMSPEQAGLSGVDVDTRSDVYALGVLLYELLTGTTPIDRETLHRAAYDEVRRIVREQDPPTPSTRLGTLGSTLPAVSANRHSDGRRLGQAVRGELDWIVMKAIEKDRARRYGTASDLAADVVRHLTDEPVQACPPSALYRLGKFARRNRAALSATTLVALVLIVGAAVSAWQAVRATRAERTTAGALGLAERHRVEVERQRDLARERQRVADRQLAAFRLRQAGEALSEHRYEATQDILEAIRPSPGDEDLRGFAWHHLWRESRRELVVLSGRSERVESIAVSPDGRTTATGDADGSIRLRETASGSLVATIRGHRNRVGSLAFSPDGRWLASAGCERGPYERNELFLWEIATGRPPVDLGDPSRRVTRLRFDPSGRLWGWSSVPNGEGIGAYLWAPGPNPSEPEPRLVRYWVAPSASDDLVSADGRFVVVTEADGGRAVEEVANGRVRFRPPPRPRGYFSAALSRDGRLVAATEWDDEPGPKLAVWDVATGRELARYVVAAPAYCYLKFSPDANLLLAYDLAGTTVVHHLDSSRAWTIPHIPADEGAEGSVDTAFADDGRILARSYRGLVTGLQPLMLYEAEGGQLRARFPGRVEAADGFAFCPDGRSVAFRSGPRAILWHFTPPDAPLQPAGHADEAWAVAFSGDRTLLATGSDDTDDPQTLKLWDTETGRLIRGWRPHEATTSAVAFQPGDRVLATAGLLTEGNLRLWDPDTGTLLASLEGHRDRVRTLAFSPDGRRLASAGSDRTLRLWDVAARRCIRTLAGHDDAIRQVAFSPDGRSLASVGNDFSVRLWDAASGTPVRTLRASAKLGAIAFSPDGRSLATADDAGVVTLREIGPGSAARILNGRDDDLRCLAFTPDGRTLAVAGRSGTVSLWDPAIGQELLSLGGRPCQVNGLAFSADGTMLAACWHDGTVRIFQAGGIPRRAPESGPPHDESW